MILVEQNYNIALSRCRISRFGTRLTRNLNLGQNVIPVKRNSIKLRYLINLLKRYQSFISPIYNAQAITFTAIADGEVTVTINIDNDIFTWTGTDSVDNMVLYFANAINELNIKYKAYPNGDTLYVYSYYTLETFNDVPIITITNSDPESPELLSFSITSLENNEEILLNLWNCITVEDFSLIKQKILNLTTC
jgi:hypothetical protein